jgi:hypothetical protein
VERFLEPEEHIDIYLNHWHRVLDGVRDDGYLALQNSSGGVKGNIAIFRIKLQSYTCMYDPGCCTMAHR